MDIVVVLGIAKLLILGILGKGLGTASLDCLKNKDDCWARKLWPNKVVSKRSVGPSEGLAWISTDIELFRQAYDTDDIKGLISDEIIPQRVVDQLPPEQIGATNVDLVGLLKSSSSYRGVYHLKHLLNHGNEK